MSHQITHLWKSCACVVRCVDPRSQTVRKFSETGQLEKFFVRNRTKNFSNGLTSRTSMKPDSSESPLHHWHFPNHPTSQSFSNRPTLRSSAKPDSWKSSLSDFVQLFRTIWLCGAPRNIHFFFKNKQFDPNLYHTWCGRKPFVSPPFDRDSLCMLSQCRKYKKNTKSKSHVTWSHTSCGWTSFMGPPFDRDSLCPVDTLYKISKKTQSPWVAWYDPTQVMDESSLRVCHLTGTQFAPLTQCTKYQKNTKSKTHVIWSHTSCGWKPFTSLPFDRDSIYPVDTMHKI